MRHMPVITEHLDLRALHWLMLAQIAVVLPHLAYLPPWLLGMACLLTGWRWLSFHGYGSLPGPWLRALIVIAAIVLFFATYGLQFSVEAAVAFFALTYGLKVLEIKKRRDLYLFIFLSFFLLAMRFLFDQSLWTALYVLLALAVCFVGLSTIANPVSGRSPLRLVSIMLLQAIPLLIAAYVLFPRIAPLWTVPMNSEQARTGISDRMNPGDIADLAQSGERAFRVRFDGAKPPQDELYWRALLLDEYVGGEWRVASQRSWFGQARPTESSAPDAVSNRYEIIQEPTGKPWGFALDRPVKLAGDYRLTSDGLVRFKRELFQSVRYQVGMSRNPPAQVPLSESDLRRHTALPAGENPATRAWVAQLGARTDDPEELARSIMRYFNSQPFLYTLKPPRLSGDQVDQFLFESRKGFCAHFAGAFTFALRAANVPARLVIGYQGGEWNPDGGYLMVHQYDAHAWTEVWLEGRGWVRFDPTAMVAPDRISLGVRQALAEEGSFLAEEPFSLSRYSQIGVAQWLRLKMDRVNYNWQRWVVQYDEESQLDLFQRWYDKVSLATLGIWLAVVFAGVVGVILFMLLISERRVESDPVKRLFRLFEKRLARQGVIREPGETPRNFAERASHKYPGAAQQIMAVYRRLEHLLYAKPGKLNPDDKTTLKQAIRRLRLHA